MESQLVTAEEWICAASRGALEEVAKNSATTRAWFAELAGKNSFAKWYPRDRLDTWAETERAISGANLHSAIVSLRAEVGAQTGFSSCTTASAERI